MSEEKLRYEPPMACEVNYGGEEVQAQACTSGGSPGEATCKDGGLASAKCSFGNVAGGQCRSGGMAVYTCKTGSTPSSG